MNTNITLRITTEVNYQLTAVTSSADAVSVWQHVMLIQQPSVDEEMTHECSS